VTVLHYYYIIKTLLHHYYIIITLLIHVAGAPQFSSSGGAAVAAGLNF
jgi:hypothetical protein